MVKGESHLPDFKIDPNDMSPDEIAYTVYDISEDVLRYPETESYLGTLMVWKINVLVRNSQSTPHN